MLYNVVHYCFNNVVQRTTLCTIVSTMLFDEQCCSTNNVVHYCFNVVVETGENNIDRTINEVCCVGRVEIQIEI